MAEMPAGIVTFLFTDIEGSVRLWERQPDSMRRLLAHHNAVLHATIDKHRGYVFKEWGDQFCAVFAEAQDAAAAAVEAQCVLYEEVPQVRVRMALHTGAAELIKGDYFGPALGHVARLLSAGHGGQILVSRATAEMLDSEVPSDSRLHLLGTHRLRDIPESETIFHLSVEGLPSEFPPLNTLDVAFRRGMRRALALSAIVLTVMLGLLVSALFERHRANRNAGLAAANYRAAIRQLALNQTEQGVKQLEEGNGLGLLDLVRARETADPLPDLRDAIASVWAGWHQSLAGRLITEVGHDREVLDVKFSPDGRLLATASEDNTVRLWDTRTWEMATPPLQHDAPVRLVTFSPDGRLLASAAGNRTWLWDTATGTPRGAPVRHDNRVTGVAFSPDGTTLASASWDQVIRLRATVPGRPAGRTLQFDYAGSGQGQPLLVGFVPPPARYLVTATPHGVSLWDPTTGKQVGLLLRRDHPSPTNPVFAVSREGAVLAIALEGMVWVWDQGKHRFCGTLFSHPQAITSLELSPSGGLLAAASREEPGVIVWDKARGARSVPVLSHPAGVNDLVFGPPTSNLLVTLSRGATRFWDTSTGQPYREPPPPLQGVSGLALSVDSRTLATVAAHGTVQVWSLSAPSPLQRLPAPPNTNCMAFRDNGKTLAVSSADGLRLYSADSGRLLSHWVQAGAAEASALSEDGELLAGWRDQTVSFWRVGTGQPSGPPLGLEQRVRYATLSRHGAVLVSMSRPSAVQLWDVGTRRPRGKPLNHPPSVMRTEFSPDERLLATASGHTVRLWDTGTGRLHCPPIRVAGSPLWVSFSPDGRLLAIPIWGDSTLTLWNTTTGLPCLRPLKHPAPVSLVAFGADGKRIATVTDENVIRLWDLVSGGPIGKGMPNPDVVWRVRFSPDGKQLAATSDSGVRLWDTATCQLASRPLHTNELVLDAQFGLNGAVVAFKGAHTVYFARLPTPPQRLGAIKLLTSTSLGVAPETGDSEVLLPWQVWRRMREKAESTR